MPNSNDNPTGRRSGQSGSMKAVAQAEKIAQVALILPVSVFVGWVLGAGLDKLFHRHWIYIAGLVFGMAAGLMQLFRMIGDPGLLAASAPEKGAPKGPGFTDKKDEEWKR